MGVTDRHDKTFAVEVALNPNTIYNQSEEIKSFPNNSVFILSS